MKKSFWTRRSSLLILMILAFETLWLLADLQILRLPFYSPKKNQNQFAVAGSVRSSQQDLKKREANSLVWENSKIQDVIYFHDSLLTLSQSSATLDLNDHTELNLSENTLVTIEENENGKNSEIRLRFSKGDLRARNPMAESRLVGDDWTLVLAKGSEVNLKKDTSGLEFEVLGGEAVLEKNGEKQNLSSKEILKFNDEKLVEKIKKSESLSWKSDTPLRIYTFEDQAEFDLAWQGSAQKLKIERGGHASESLPLASDQNQFRMKLATGSYQVRLDDGQAVSNSRRLEVWKAPHILLKSPLPRDRLKSFKPQSFVWVPTAGVREYRIKLFNAEHTFDQSSLEKKNFKELKFDQEADLLWRVEALDDEGHEIPAFYESPIFIRHDPLAAPKLKAPRLRKPAREGASHGWLMLLFNTAFAQSRDSEEAVFEWEPVEGADQYVIEISSQSDFRKPEVIRTLKEPRFVWKNFDQKKYHWRVAAGTSKGRLGLFTSVQVLHFEDATWQDPTGSVTRVQKQSVAQAPPQSTPEPVKAPEPVLAPVEEFKSSSIWSYAWAPSYKYTDLSGDQSSKIQLLGFVPLGLNLDFEKTISKTEFYRIRSQLTQGTWKPSPANTFPFQENLTIPELWVHAERGPREGDQLWGLSLHQSFLVQRLANESIKAKSIFLLGGRYAKDFKELNRTTKEYGISILTGEANEVSVDFRIKKYLSDDTQKTRSYYGYQGNLLYQNYKSVGGTQGNLSVFYGVSL